MIKRHATFIHEWSKLFLFDQDRGVQKAAFLKCRDISFDPGIEIMLKNATFSSGFWIEIGKDMRKNPPGYKWEILEIETGREKNC